MGSDQSTAAQQATSQNLALSNELYGIAKPALSSAMGYLTGARQSGQFLDTSGKYDAMRTNFMDSTAGMTGSFLDPKGMGNALSGQASGLSGIGAEQIGGAVDQMNEIRSLLAGQGLKTTGMAASAGALETQALGYMNAGNATASTIKGIAGGAAALYGAGRDQGWWGQASKPGFNGVNYAGQMPGMAAASWGNGPSSGMGLGPINWGR